MRHYFTDSAQFNVQLSEEGFLECQIDDVSFSGPSSRPAKSNPPKKSKPLDDLERAQLACYQQMQATYKAQQDLAEKQLQYVTLKYDMLSEENSI